MPLVTKMSDSRPIGIFDSGVGGLTVARQIMGELPNERLVYFGDCARAPYGGRTAEELAAFSRQIIGFLAGHDVKALVVACGTISARIFHQVQAMTNIPAVGMVAAGVNAVLETKKTSIAVAATAGTVASKAHEKAICAANPDIRVISIACPDFVTLAESGLQNSSEADSAAAKYLGGLGHVEALLLGCTHYPLLQNSIAKAMPGAEIIDPAAGLTRELKTALARRGLLSTAPGQHKFFVSGGPEKFAKMAEIVLKQKHNIETIEL